MEVFLKRMSNILAVFASLILLLVMMITFVDVVGRYFFDSPVNFAVELIQLGMGLLVLFGLAITTLERGHIAVDLVESVASRSVKRLLAKFAALCGLVFIALIAWRLWDRGVKFLGDGLATDILFLPVWPVVLLMSVAAGAATLVALYQIVKPSEGAHMGLGE